MKYLMLLLLFVASAVAQELPDAPGSSKPEPTRFSASATLPTKNMRLSVEPKPRKTADASFWTSTAIMAATSVANVELSHQCIMDHRCTLEQLPSKTRLGMYAVTLPVDFGTALVAYKLKKHGHRWWFTPIAALTAAQSYSLTHAATQLGK